MNDFDEYLDEDNIETMLEKAIEEIQTDVEEDQDKDSINRFLHGQPSIWLLWTGLAIFHG